MTYEGFVAELRKAGLSVRAFADLLGMNRNSVSNYARSSGVPRHLAIIAALIGEMNVKGIAFREIFARIDVTPRKVRGSARRGRFGGDKQEQLKLD